MEFSEAIRSILDDDRAMRRVMSAFFISKHVLLKWASGSSAPNLGVQKKIVRMIERME